MPAASANDGDVQRLRRAALDGNCDAAYQLGVLCEEGRFGNAGDAITWIRTAADGGNSDAQYHLGFILDSGNGLPQNVEEAAAWYSLQLNRLLHNDVVSLTQVP